MDFIRTLMVIAIVVVVFQFFIWLLPYIAVIVLLYWGAKYFNNKLSAYKEKRGNKSSSEVYYINNDNILEKEIVDVEYEDVQ
ncbi:hypothetical protein GCM10008905_11730 [Clostridium malenominatum]|uniref:DUF4834 domain-containing protein n=1 Tax=Clostridium malenominatum TaxID=1539 RepID=A0ABN1IUP0_9CLOT